MSSSEPIKRRLHWVAAIVTGLRSLPQLVPVLIVVALSRGTDPTELWPMAMALLLLPISIAFGIVRWWRYRYWVEQGETACRTGTARSAASLSATRTGAGFSTSALA